MHLVRRLGRNDVLLPGIALRVPNRAVLLFDSFENMRSARSPTTVRKNRVG